MVTEVSTFVTITQVSNGFKKSHILIFSKFKYLHYKIASLATVKSCVTIGPIFALTEDTSMTIVSSSGVRLQKVLSLRLGKKG